MKVHVRLGCGSYPLGLRSCGLSWVTIRRSKATHKSVQEAAAKAVKCFTA